MGFYAMDLGLDMRQADYTTFADTTAIKEDWPDNYYSNKAIGVSGRIQTSIAALFQDTTKKFLIADVFSAEAGTGYLSSQFSSGTGNLWLNYRFDLGLGLIYKFNKDKELGFNLILLEFGKDNVSQSTSGSAILLKYRYKRYMLEAGTVSTRNRFIGLIASIAEPSAVQIRVVGNYFLSNKKTVGVRWEMIPDPFRGDRFDLYSGIWSLRIFYGIYF